MSHVIIDSNYTSLHEAIRGTTAPVKIQRTLVLVEVTYLSFDDCVHQGQLVIHRELEHDVRELFASLLSIKFPIQKVVPIASYEWNDETSMADNNTSAFNYRLILGTDRLSNHSYGRALDINPQHNPYFARDGKVYPNGAVYTPSVPGTLTSNGEAIRLFKDKGWVWGGDWTVPVDYQHLEKPLL